MVEDQLTEPQAPKQEPSFVDKTKEKIGSSPLSAGIKEDLQSYFDFAGNSMPYSDTIYKEFYVCDARNIDELAENDHIVEQGMQYRDNVIMAADTIKKAREASGEAAILYWPPLEHSLRINTGEGYNYNDKLGRLYLNIKPEQIAEALPRIVTALEEANVNTQLKALCPSEHEASPTKLARYMARKDKVVLYFNEPESEAVIAAIEAIYNEVEGAMAEGTPRLAARIKGSNGEVMQGVGFGEEPANGSIRESFGQVRSKLLSQLSLEATHPVYGQGEFIAIWQHCCEQFGINPDNPAFNAGEQHFKAILARAA